MQPFHAPNLHHVFVRKSLNSISPEENYNSEAFPLPQNLKGVAVKEGKTFLDEKAIYFVA